MEHSDARGFRLVRCPRCHRVLPEPGGVPVYSCGGCGTTLRAKKRTSSTGERAVLPPQSRHLDSSEVVNTSRSSTPTPSDASSTRHQATDTTRLRETSDLVSVRWHGSSCFASTSSPTDYRRGRDQGTDSSSSNTSSDDTRGSGGIAIASSSRSPNAGGEVPSPFMQELQAENLEPFWNRIFKTSNELRPRRRPRPRAKEPSAPQKLSAAKQRLPPRNYCRPVLKGAPFIVCSSCLKLVQLPADLAISTNTACKLRCGSCSAVLSYSYTDPTTSGIGPRGAFRFHGSTSLGTSEGSESHQSFVTEVSSNTGNNKECNKDGGSLFLGISDIGQVCLEQKTDFHREDNGTSRNESGINLAFKTKAGQLSLADDDDDHIYSNQAQGTKAADIEHILKEGQHRWLRPAEICEILKNYRNFCIAPEPPNRPPSGSLFLFDRKVLRYFRKDGHNWRKKNDQKTVKEAHERLKSDQVLHCYYAHGEENINFQRRTYWMLEEEFMHIVLVHYLETKGGKSSRSRVNNNMIPEAAVDSPLSQLPSQTIEGESSEYEEAESEYLKQNSGGAGYHYFTWIQQHENGTGPVIDSSVFSSYTPASSIGKYQGLHAMTQNTSFYPSNQHNSPLVLNGPSNMVATNGHANQTDLPSSILVIELDHGPVQMPLQFPVPPGQGTSAEGLGNDYLTFDEVYSDGLSLKDIGAAGADGESFWQVEEPHSTSYKDVMAWVAMGKQRQNGLNHTCMQQVGHKPLGRDDIRQNIIENILLDRNGGSNCTVICINGGSGLGKTSLLHALYNNKELMDAFDKRIWVQIHNKFDMLMLFRKIIEFLMNDHCSITNIDLLRELVMEEITNKKLLLFLDDADIEHQQFWNSTLEALNTSAKGSAIVMATRSSTDDAALRDVATHSYFLNPLPEEDNMLILQRCSGVGADIQSNTDLFTVAKRLISRFGSNLLNLKAIGSLLCYADTISLENDRFEGSVMPLQLCHDVLPIHLKKCLAFCSLFPEDYIFDKHHMVLEWISHGCVRPAEGCELEDVGIEYFNELLFRSFFQYSPVHHDKDDKFVIPKLMYKVVESVSRDKYFKSEDPTCSIPENILHLSLVSYQFQTVELIFKTQGLNDLQTFMVVQPEWQPYKIPFPTLKLVGLDDFFLKFTSLETLDLSHTDTKELPGSIVGLRNLQYLSVNNTSIKTLPSELCSLSNLQTLEAKDCCFLTELPGDTKKLLKLRHLDLTKDLGYVKLPQGVGQLTELQTLPVFHASSDPSHCSISELGNLHNLRGCLQLSGLESVKTGSKAQEANLKGKHHLNDLTLHWHDDGVDINDEDEDAENVAEQVLESLQPHTNLQELAIRGYEGSVFPAWMQDSSSLPNLMSLTLDSCSNCTRFPAISQLPSLKFLSIRKMYDVQRLTNNIHGATKFPSLELLNLWEMYGLQELFEASEGDCPRLRKVCISRCPDLKALSCTPSLTELVLHCGRHVPAIPELVSLVSLKIEGFHGVKSFSLPVAKALPALKKLEVRSCKELSLVHGLSALTNVQRLKIAGCPKLVLPRTDSLTT